MAERLTEHKTTKGITRIVIKPYVVMSDEMQPIADKLCAFEDILEKYGIDMQNLDYILEEYSKNQGRDLFICEEMDKLKRDLDTYKKACELACEYMCKFVIPCPDIHRKECENICDINKSRCYEDYFYQQAKNGRSIELK